MEDVGKVEVERWRREVFVGRVVALGNRANLIHYKC